MIRLNCADFRALARLTAPITLSLALFAAGGCAGKFATETEYLAPDFTRASLGGRTLAVLPETDASGERRNYDAELDGITLGFREAGARVRVVPAGDDAVARTEDETVEAAQSAGCGGAPPAPDTSDALADPGASHDVAVSRGREIDAAYVLIVRFTDAEIYRAYAVPQHRGGNGRAAPATRTSGRRVGLRLELVRVADGATRWLAGGKGEMWRTRTAAAPGAAPAAANVDADLGGGNLPLYPAPPRGQTVTRRLVRRLLAHLPSLPELQPN